MGRKVAAKQIAIGWAVSYATLNITSGILGEQGLEKTTLWEDSFRHRRAAAIIAWFYSDNIKAVKALSKLSVKSPIF